MAMDTGDVIPIEKWIVESGPKLERRGELWGFDYPGCFVGAPSDVWHRAGFEVMESGAPTVSPMEIWQLGHEVDGGSSERWENAPPIEVRDLILVKQHAALRRAEIRASRAEEKVAKLAGGGNKRIQELEKVVGDQEKELQAQARELESQAKTQARELQKYHNAEMERPKAGPPAQVTLPKDTFRGVIHRLLNVIQWMGHLVVIWSIYYLSLDWQSGAITFAVGNLLVLACRGIINYVGGRFVVDV